MYILIVKRVEIYTSISISIPLTQRVQFFMHDMSIYCFIHTYRRIRLGKEIISSIAFRSGTSADRFVNAFYISSSHEPYTVFGLVWLAKYII